LFLVKKQNLFINYTNRQNICMLRRAIRHSCVITDIIRLTWNCLFVSQHLEQAHEITTGFKCGSCCSIFSFLCNVLYIHVYPFSFGHCNVPHSSIYSFWLPFYLQRFTLIISKTKLYWNEGATRRLTAADCFWKKMKWWIVITMFIFNRCDHALYSYSFIE
jgi:hypothetical protein